VGTVRLWKWGFWFRIGKGWGFMIKQRVLFSERNKLTPALYIGKWMIRILKPSDLNIQLKKEGSA